MTCCRSEYAEWRNEMCTAQNMNTPPWNSSDKLASIREWACSGHKPILGAKSPAHVFAVELA